MWRNPKIVPKEVQSTASEVVEVLVALPQHYANPVPGYYLPGLEEWRIVGSNSPFDILAWHALPKMPREDQLFWRHKAR